MARNSYKLSVMLITMLIVLAFPCNTFASSGKAQEARNKILDKRIEREAKKILPPDGGAAQKAITAEVFQNNGAWLSYKHAAYSTPDAEVQLLAQRLKDNNIKYTYLNAGILNKKGQLTRDPSYAGIFIGKIKSYYPELKVLAWINGSTEGKDKLILYGPSRDTLIRNISNQCLTIVSKYGFDGVQLDIEPVRSGDSGYLALIRLIDSELNNIDQSRLLSIVGQKLSDAKSRSSAWYWSNAYMREISKNADSICITTYNSGAKTAIAYEGWLRQQFSAAIASREPACLIQFGAPAYKTKSSTHDPKVENLYIFFIAMGNILSTQPVVPDVGVSIYGIWEMTDSDWQIVYDYLGT